MDLNQIVKKALAEIGGEQHSALIPALVKKIQPILEGKAKRLITHRRLQQVFVESLKAKTKNETKQPIETKETTL
jgi:hypothetical protein